jgi:hypothetical protein
LTRISKRTKQICGKLANDAHLRHVQFLEEKVSGKISWRKRQIAIILEQAQEKQ